ncbi:unnamed protein product, partial [Brassica oleracea var. botrytis]
MKPRVDQLSFMHFIKMFKFWTSFGLNCILCLYVS